MAAGAPSSALIPVIAGPPRDARGARAWRVVSDRVTLMLASLAVLALIVFVLAPWLVPLITPGFDDAQLAETIELTRIMVLAPLFLAAGAVATSVLNASHRFGAAALAPLVYNLAIIGAALFLAPSMGVNGPRDRRRRSAPSATCSSRSRRCAGRRAAPGPRRPRATRRARGAAADGAAGARARGSPDRVRRHDEPRDRRSATGAITAFNFAFAMLQIPIGVIGVPLGVVLLPSLSRELARGDVDAFLRLLVRAIRLLLFVMLPIAALGIVVRTTSSRCCSTTATSASRASSSTGEALAVFLVGLAAHSLIAVLARAFYALKDTITPVARRADRGRRQHRARDPARRPVRPGRARGRDRDRGVGRDAAPGRPPRRPASPALGLRVGRRRRARGPCSRRSRRRGRAGSCTGPARPRGARTRAQLIVLVRLVASPPAGGLVFVAGALALRIPELPHYRRGDGRPRAPARARVTALPRRTAELGAVHGRPTPAPGTRRVEANPLGSYLQLSRWARVKAVNGWSARPVSTPGRGADRRRRSCVRRPGPLPWAFAYAPRGPVLGTWDADAIERVHRARPRRPGGAGRAEPPADRPRDRARRGPRTRAAR